MVPPDLAAPSNHAIERLSVRWVALGLLVLIGLVTLALNLWGSHYYRNTAIAARTHDLGQLVALATANVLGEVQRKSLEFGAAFENTPAFRAAFAALTHDRDDAPLRAALDDPLVNGYAGVDVLTLERLRVYDAKLQPLTQSDQGLAGLPSGLAPGLRRLIEGRQGAERLQAAGGLWLTPQGPRYSTLVPIGGLRLQGYLELVIDPTLNLARIEQVLLTPIRVRPATAPLDPDVPPGVHRLEHTLTALDGAPAYRMEALIPIQAFEADIRHAGFFLLGLDLFGSVLTLILVYLLIQRLLLSPLHQMRDTILRSLDENQRYVVRTHGLQEFSDLARGFNGLMAQVQEQQAMLRGLSLTDELTGLGNRRAFNLALEREWNRAMRHGEALSLLILDIDHFKRYNDTYGHQQGDHCLERVARVIGGAVTRSADLACRYGGEEFAVILPATDSAGAHRIAEKIAGGVRQLDIPHAGSPEAGQVTLSIGVSACRPQAPISDACLVECADRALYAAKVGGRNRVVGNLESVPIRCPLRGEAMAGAHPMDGGAGSPK